MADKTPAGYATLKAHGREHYTRIINKRWNTERAIADDPEVVEAKARLKEAKERAKERLGIA